MATEIRKGNLFTSKAKAIILTVDGAARGMEGNIARAFGRLYPGAWEEFDYDIEYTITLGSAKIYKIDPDIECNHTHVMKA